MGLLELFRKPRISGEIVDLVKAYEISGDEYDYPSIYYNILKHDTNTVVGRCDLRVGENVELYYAGNIGYSIDIEHRGNGFAYHACNILFKIAKEEYNMKDLIITCSPNNIASYKTCLKLNGKLLETVMVPEDHWLYAKGEIEKHIFLYKL